VFVHGECLLLSGVEVVSSLLLISCKILTKRKEELSYLYRSYVGNTSVMASDVLVDFYSFSAAFSPIPGVANSCACLS